MIESLLLIAGAVSLLAGAAFALFGALGVLRFPDVYTRMHAASKAGLLGSGFCLVAVALVGSDAGVTTRALAAAVFLMVTAPVSAHLLARAAFRAGYPSTCDLNAYSSEVDRQEAAHEEDGR